jgi:hypothetical protein
MKTRNAKPPAKVGPGRQTVRTAANAERIFHAVSLGVPFHHATTLAGISYSTFCAWRVEDAEFRERLDAAIAAGVEKRLNTILTASENGDWRASEAWLRLVLPMEFGRNRIELSGPGGSPLAGVVAIMLPPKQDGNGGQLPAVSVSALAERNADGNGG